MSPTTNPSVCRYCNSRRQLDQCDGVIRFACGTTMQASTNKTITQSTECKLRIELTSARARIAELEGELAKLNDPVAVHINMLRGTIATPSVELMEHVWQRPATATPLERPDKPGWWWVWIEYNQIGWSPVHVDEYTLTRDVPGKWLPATPPPAPKEGEGGV
jgi:hypothetical protein